MSYAQLSLDEVRVLRAVATRTLATSELASPQSRAMLRALVNAGLIQLSSDASSPSLTEEGRAWLTVYGLGPS